MTAEQEERSSSDAAPGGLESLPDDQRERFLDIHDSQLERATDVLKGITLYAKRASAAERAPAKRSEKVPLPITGSRVNVRSLPFTHRLGPMNPACFRTSCDETSRGDRQGRAVRASVVLPD